MRRLCTANSVPWDLISKTTIYPIINGKRGSDVALKFLAGLERVGLGKYCPTTKYFKRSRVNDDDPDEKERIAKRFKLFNINL